MTREELREKVIETMLLHKASDAAVDAAIAIIRGETLEEAAEAVEAFYGHGMTLEHAAAIRALKEGK